MDKKISALFNTSSVHYPHELARQYPGILDKIVDLWNSAEIDAYFSELMLDTRGDQRQGFPPDVAEEILRLSVVNTKNRDSRKPHSWLRIPEKDRAKLTQLGFKYTQHDFFSAAKLGNAQAVHIFLRTYAPMETQDAQGWTPLIHAAACGHAAVVYLLIQFKANVHSKDRHGYCALHWTAFNGHDSIVKLLIENQADVNARSNLGWTPLIQAAAQGHMMAVALLIRAGADVNWLTNDNWTALHKASANGHTETVKLLLTKGADSTRPRHNGDTALSLSTTGKHKAIVDMLSTTSQVQPLHKPGRH